MDNPKESINSTNGKVHTSLPQCTPLGILYITLSMVGSAAVPMIQEHVIVLYNVSVEDLL